MPNWCNVDVTFNHSNTEMLDRIRNAVSNKTGVLAEFIPVPAILKQDSATIEERVAECGYSDWHQFCTTNWGTKWDLCEPVLSVNDNGSITISCETAWAPPIDAFDAMVQMGFDILAYYYEPGMQFAGIYTTDTHDEYDSWGDADGADQVLPAELNNFFEIAINQRECEEEEREYNAQFN